METLIYNYAFAGEDWGFTESNFVDYETALQQSYKIAAVPVMCNIEINFAFQTHATRIDLSLFDLVLLSDIEYTSISNIQQWAKDQGIQKYLLAIGGTHAEETLPDNTIYRPWWVFNLMKMNTVNPVNLIPRPFTWECLLGARRPHRDFAMLSFQHNGLLDQNIVNYREFFAGEVIDDQSQEVAAKFPNQTLAWPYVSTNLDPNWEVRDNLDKSISPFVPWKIYNQCNYSVVCETLGTGSTFFFSEKTGKALFGHRLFLSMSVYRFLDRLKLLGFETFGNVINESYDNVPMDLLRFQKVFEQILYLSKQNPVLIFEKVRPILEHNHNRLFSLRDEKRKKMQSMIQENVKFS